MTQLDLLNPVDLQSHYVHQIRQTIEAYDASQIVIGEALQNSIDAIVLAGGGRHVIDITIDFDGRTVTVKDDGVGFPNDPTLLYLGGGRKRQGSKKLFGLVGVGIKVVLFSSDRFLLRARTESAAIRCEITDAYRFDSDPPPALRVPPSFPDDPEPIEKQGTFLSYRFPKGTVHDPFGGFVTELLQVGLPSGADRDFGETLTSAVAKGVFPHRFAALLACYLRRFTYVGDVLNRLGGKNELSDTTVSVSLHCSDPVGTLGEEAGTLFDGVADATFSVSPTYLLVEDTAAWLPTILPTRPRPSLARRLIRLVSMSATLHRNHSLCQVYNPGVLRQASSCKTAPSRW
ncbi:MAG: hypothetical protein ACE5JI_21850 [Acidobacteriota bacterium]